MPRYTPFDQPIHRVEPADIYSIEAPEGYYVEYKRSFIEKSKIAKLVASFANTYGGTMFLGIDENTQDNTSENFFCISGSGQDYKEKIRGIVNSRVDPPPRFTSHIIENSSNDIVVIVSIPESRNTPHITNDGKVYRRTGEQSQPITGIKDSDSLDKLHERKSRWRRRMADFCNLSISLTKGQTEGSELSSGWPYLELYGIPSTLGENTCSEVVEDIDTFREYIEASELYLYRDEPTSIGGYGYSNFAYRGTNDGIVAQDLRDPDHIDNISHTPMTVSFFSDGGLKVFLPIESKNTDNITEPNHQMLVDEFGSNIDEIIYLNGSKLLVSALVVLNSYISLLDECDWTSNRNRELYAKARVVNVFRTATLFPGSWYQEIIQEYGVPVCYENISEIPRMGYYDLNWEIDERTTSILDFLTKVLQSLGIPIDQRPNISTELINELQRI